MSLCLGVYNDTSIRLCMNLFMSVCVSVGVCVSARVSACVPVFQCMSVSVGVRLCVSVY